MNPILFSYHLFLIRCSTFVRDVNREILGFLFNNYQDKIDESTSGSS